MNGLYIQLQIQIYSYFKVYRFYIQKYGFLPNYMDFLSKYVVSIFYIR